MSRTARGQAGPINTAGVAGSVSVGGCNALRQPRRSGAVIRAVTKLRHLQQSGLQRSKGLVDDAVDLDPLAQRSLPLAERPLPGYANFADPRLTRGGLDPLNQLADLPLEGVGFDEQIRFEDDEEISVICSGPNPELANSPSACTISARPNPL
jgi:hypothetical protein